MSLNKNKSIVVKRGAQKSCLYSYFSEGRTRIFRHCHLFKFPVPTTYSRTSDVQILLPENDLRQPRAESLCNAQRNTKRAFQKYW